MPTDLLVLAGNASEILERHGLVACGRREDGVTRVDFWSRNGTNYRYELRDEDLTTDAVVAICLAMAEVTPSASPRGSHLS